MNKTDLIDSLKKKKKFNLIDKDMTVLMKYKDVTFNPHMLNLLHRSNSK